MFNDNDGDNVDDVDDNVDVDDVDDDIEYVQQRRDVHVVAY
jgi:hypothetical protein